MDDDLDEPSGEIRCVAAWVHYDGTIGAELVVPGYDEVQPSTFPGTPATLLLTWSEDRPIDLDGTSAADRRCQEIIAHHVARLQHELERQWRVQARRRREQREREMANV